MVKSYIASASDLLLRQGFGAEAVMAALEIIGRGLGVDRVYIFEDSIDPETGGRLMSQRYEWSADGVVSELDNPELQDLSYDSMVPDWVGRFADGREVSGLVCEMNSPARELLESQQILSILLCPIHVGGQCWGFVGFDDCQQPRIWPDPEVRALSALAKTLGASLRHFTMKRRLDEARAQLRAIANA
jgi:GAF domain-containing protein